MNRNDFLVALFGRPVWFQCNTCRRVMAGATQECSPETWLDEAAAMEAGGVKSEDLWWFHTICTSCQEQHKS